MDPRKITCSLGVVTIPVSTSFKKCLLCALAYVFGQYKHIAIVSTDETPCEVLLTLPRWAFRVQCPLGSVLREASPAGRVQ